MPTPTTPESTQSTHVRLLINTELSTQTTPQPTQPTPAPLLHVEQDEPTDDDYDKF